MKNKIAFTVIPVLIFAIIIINLAFGIFFQSFIQRSEQNQMDSSATNISSYLNGKTYAYLGTVNDWGHWDDTNYFLRNQNSDYIDLNMTEDVFESLDLSFMILLKGSDSVAFQQYYEFDVQQFSAFPSGFFDGFDAVVDFSEIAEDTAGILKIGDGFYFVASTSVTDSLMTEEANGALIIGRKIDGGIIAEMEKISGCSILSTGVLNNTDDLRTGGEAVILSQEYDPDAKGSINIELAVPNDFDLQSSIVISMIMTRDLYLSGMKEVIRFSVANTAGSIIVCAVIFFLLGNYITKPFSSLIYDVKSIGTKESDFKKLPESGTDEFSFLRKTINNLLERLESNQKELVESKEELQATLTSVGDGVIVVDTEGKIQFLNPVAQKLTGWALEAAKGAPLQTVFNIINEYTRETVESPVIAVFESEEIVELSNHTLLVSKNGNEIPIEDTAAPIKDLKGTVIGCVLVFRDFSERKEKQRYIEYLSFHDQLTGLYNRRFFEEEVRRIDVQRNLPLSFIYADVNGLKIINDAFGHEQGDKLIQQVADVLKAGCRADDIIARIGGDEFVILLPNTTRAETEELVKRLGEKPIKIMNINVSISFGWETKCEAEKPAFEALKSAENYMYQKKILNSSSKRNGIIKSILHTLQVKSPREESHSGRVSKYCEQIGYAYQLSSDEIREISTAGELHDIGKIAVDETVLNKSGGLSVSDWAQLKQHPETGYRLLGATAEFNNIAECVLAHHERWDGKGYPKRLKGEEINWKARVIAIADAFDAMTCERPYRKALSREEAIEELKKNAGTQFDPEIVKVFIEKVLS